MIVKQNLFIDFFQIAFVIDLLMNRYSNFKIVMAYTNEIVTKDKGFYCFDAYNFSL